MNQLGDQAQRLRQRVQDQQGAQIPKLPSIAITGGKGGVGKTCMAVNLSLALQQMQVKSLLVDLDLGLANADILLGLNPQHTLYDVINGTSNLASCMNTHASGLDLIPAASGREELTRISQNDLNGLIQLLQTHVQGYGISFLDTAAGISREVTSFIRSCRSTIMVVTPDPTSMTDAYALIKTLEQQEPGKDLAILINQASNDEEALLLFQKLQIVCQTYLKRDIRSIGHVPQDRWVTEAVRQRKPFIFNPDSRAAAAIRGIAIRLKGEIDKR